MIKLSFRAYNTENTILYFNVLAQQLEQVRATGFAFEVEESNRNIRCIAAPLRKQGAIVASISVAVPLVRYSEKKETVIKTLLDQARQQVESLIAGIDIRF